MDFDSQISALVEKSLKAAAPAGQTVCWQSQPIAWPPPSGRANPAAKLVIVFWLVVPGTASWCYSVQGMTLSSALPAQAEVDVVVSTALADLAAQMAKWKP